MGFRAALCEFCRERSPGSRKNLPPNTEGVRVRTSTRRSAPDARDGCREETGCGRLSGTELTTDCNLVILECCLEVYKCDSFI